MSLKVKRPVECAGLVGQLLSGSRREGVVRQSGREQRLTSWRSARPASLVIELLKMETRYVLSTRTAFESSPSVPLVSTAAIVNSYMPGARLSKEKEVRVPSSIVMVLISVPSTDR